MIVYTTSSPGHDGTQKRPICVQKRHDYIYVQKRHVYVYVQKRHDDVYVQKRRI
jgi:hypothetical protein